MVGPFVANTHYTVSNVPAGLTLAVTRDSNTQVTLALTGKASSHANVNDISDLGITFLDAAFTGGKANTITGYKKSDLVIDFNDPVANAAPTAATVKITGNGTIGQELTGSYIYNDTDGDAEGTSIFKWYRGDAADGTGKQVITGATAKTYTLTPADADKYIFFEVTPVASSGTATGSLVVSLATLKISLQALTVTSTSFNDGAKIPDKFVKPGEGYPAEAKNTSIQLNWATQDAPNGYSYFVIMVDKTKYDNNPINFVHWAVKDIPNNVKSLNEGVSIASSPAGNMNGLGNELKNNFPELGYGGPQPPKGIANMADNHEYVTEVYLLNVGTINTTDETDSYSYDQLKTKIAPYIVGYGKITGYYAAP